KKIKTPALDAMAAGGIQFNRFYAGHPSCSPCRASVLTGRNPNRMGCFWPGMPIKKQEVTIAQAVKKAGYATAHFGKWHLNGVAGPGKPIPATDPLGPMALGFDEMFSVSNYFDTDWTFSRNGESVKVKGDGSDAIVAEALTFAEKNAKKGTPFLALVWFGSPHSPNKPTAEDQQKAGGSTYYGELVGVDRAMGTLRAGLRKLGIADDTMIVFNSDNGGWPEEKAPDNSSCNGPLRGRKGDLYEGGIRVPGLIEWPSRIPKPFVSEVPVCTIDMYPTVMDILKLKVSGQVEPIDGMSILPVLEGKTNERSKPIGFWQFDDTIGPMDTNTGPSAWMEQRYKLVKAKKDKWELYDIPADISEKNDIAAANPGIVNRMKAELEAWHQGVLKSNAGMDYTR
ncbi:MAG: sulfatase-like hydrolase/transferase, partial [bacterium]